MRAALLLIALAASPFDRPHDLPPPLRVRHVPSGLSGTPFSLSLTTPASACTGAAVTLSSGAPVTITSAKARYCNRGAWLTGIQPGQLALIAPNAPRIMPGGDGTGPLRLWVDPAITNYAFRSEEFDNALVWNVFGTNVAAPTVTANFEASPDGGVTAERIQFAAVSGVDESGIYQNFAVGPGAASSAGYFLKATTGGTTPDGGWTWVATFNGTWNCKLVQVPPFDRGYSVLGQEDAGDISYMMLGNVSNRCGASQALPALDVVVWGASAVNSRVFTSYVPTAAAAVTTSADVAEAVALVPMNANLSITSQFQPEGYLTAATNVVELNNHDGLTYNSLARIANRAECAAVTGGGSTTWDSTATWSTQADTLSCAWDGVSTLQACVNGACDGGVVASNPTDTLYVDIGSHWNGAAYDTFAGGGVGPFTISENSRKSIYIYGDGTVDGHTVYPSFTPQSLLQRQYNNKLAVKNDGASGQRTWQTLPTFDAELARVISADQGLSSRPTASRNYWLIQMGVNDLNDDNDAGRAIANIEQMLLDGQDAGVHMCWATITPYRPNQTLIHFANGVLSTFATAHNIPQVDTFSGLVDPADGGAYNAALACLIPTTCLVDEPVHPNDAGEVVQLNLWEQGCGWSR